MFLTSYRKDSELATKQSFKLCESMAEKGKPFGDGNIHKKLFDNIHCICMPRGETFGKAN